MSLCEVARLVLRDAARGRRRLRGHCSTIGSHLATAIESVLQRRVELARVIESGGSGDGIDHWQGLPRTEQAHLTLHRLLHLRRLIRRTHRAALCFPLGGRAVLKLKPEHLFLRQRPQFLVSQPARRTADQIGKRWCHLVAGSAIRAGPDALEDVHDHEQGRRRKASRQELAQLVCEWLIGALQGEERGA
eukprot:2951574-Prymnesium_polylepis.1